MNAISNRDNNNNGKNDDNNNSKRPLPDHSKEIHCGKFPLAGAQIYTHILLVAFLNPDNHRRQ